MTQLAQIALSIASEISSIENRERKRSADAQKHFEHAIECLLKDLWLGTVIHPEYEVGIHRRSNWYSETPQYRDPNLTYPQAIAAYDGMTLLDLIRVSKEAYLTQGRPELYNEDMVHYITDDQFAYAAAVNGIMQRDEPAACLYMGKFFAESLLFAETGNSIGAIQIAGTGSQTQIPFFVTACDYTLMGEEFFAASAYLSQEADLIAGITAQDLIKVILVIVILFGTVCRALFDLGLISFDFITLIGI